MKICSKCKTSKSFDQFSPDRRAKDGLQSRCKSCNAEYSRGRAVAPEKNKEYQIKYRYGITSERYEEMMREQEYSCAACGVEFGTGSKRPEVDHDHTCCKGYKTCGKCVRGILCQKCNTLAGKLEYNIEYLNDILWYLTFHIRRDLGEIPEEIHFSKRKMDRMQSYLNKHSDLNKTMEVN